MARGVSEFRAALRKLSKAMDGDVGKMIAVLTAQTPAEALALITDAYPQLVTPYLAAAGDLTATWYEDQAPDVDFIAEPAELAPVEQLATNGRWSLTQANPATALKGSARRQLFQTHRDTVLTNAEREGIAWAREARPGACGFCRMLATRVLTEGLGGAPGLYRSAESAGATPHTQDAEGHDHCQCIAVPLRSGEPYVIPGYVHDWLDDYEAVSRDDSGRLLPVSRIVALMEQRGAQRGDPVRSDADGREDRRGPAVVDLDAGTRPPVTAAPADPREPLALPAGQSAGRLAIEAPQAQRAITRRPQPLALAPGRTPLMLTAAPSRPAVAAPDPGRIAEWLDAEDEHRHAVEYWRRVDVENLHSPQPAAEAIPDPPPPAEPAEPVDVAVPDDPAPVVDVQTDDHAGETPLNRATRELNEAIESGDEDRIDAAIAAMDAAEAAEKAATKRAAARKAKAEQLADTEQDAIVAAIEAGEDPQHAEAEVLVRRPSQRAKIRDLVKRGLYDQQSAEQVVYRQVLERIRRRDFMHQARADGHTGKGFDDLLDSVFWLRVEELYMEAENATRGSMIKRKYALKFDPKRFWYVNDATARKYMSDELAEWFDQNGRLTRPVLRQMILEGETDWKRYNPRRGDYLE